MKDLVNFTTRLQKILTFYDLSASGLATKIGVQRSSISHIVSGRNKPSLDFIIKLLDTFEEVAFEWIISGKGGFPKSDTPTPIQKPVGNLFSDAEKINRSTSEEKTETIQKTENPPFIPNSDNLRILDKIILLYKDGSFDSYQK